MKALTSICSWVGAFHCLGGLEELSWADVWTRELEQAVLLEFFWSRFLGPKTDNFQKKMAQQMKPKPQEFNPMRWHGLGQLVI